MLVDVEMRFGASGILFSRSWIYTQVLMVCFVMLLLVNVFSEIVAMYMNGDTLKNLHVIREYRTPSPQRLDPSSFILPSLAL